jgi:hypothetical protein
MARSDSETGGRQSAFPGASKSNTLLRPIKRSTARGNRVASRNKALRFWLRWNADFEHATAAMFDGKGSLVQMEDDLDMLDQRRQEAKQYTRHLLNE